MNSTSSLICLGIESTAHTFSVGIISSDRTILSMVNDTYVPDQGGLHPQKVVEHHYNCFLTVLEQAITKAKITIKQINLIAFSQGPGLGVCLRIGAAVARTLALKLQVPLIGVNHCVAHVEIGRLLCQVEDPLTLYVSGGSTIISAFESNRYQILGETLDISIGNLLDMVARDLNLPHPGGPKLEQLAKQGSLYYPIPYVVKGMDLSFSGIYSALVKKLHGNNHLEQENIQLVYSLQETAFSMLTEVTERALAHTKKKHVLLTGGVAANQRLQQMLAYICQDHNAQFNVVPKQYAGDNGVMIAWTGILQYQSSQGLPINKSTIIPKWRMDSIRINWRKSNRILNPEIIHQKLVDNLDNKTQKSNNVPSENVEQENTELGIKGIEISKGAEAQLIRTSWFDRDVIYKYRFPKSYRIEAIDKEIRTQRTLLESRVLLDLGSLGIPVPPLYEVDLKKNYIVMKYIIGHPIKEVIDTLSHEERQKIFYTIGQIIANIHQNDKIHGDLTTSNIIYTNNSQIYFIDFGLAQYSTALEDKAIDIHLFKRVLTSCHGNYFPDIYDSFLQGYESQSPTNMQLLRNKIEEIELRGRYIEKEKRRK